MRVSPTVTETDLEAAWRDLVALGWSLYTVPGGPRSYAVCPQCSAAPFDLDTAVAAAKKGRRRK
jgi:hypothetical protein